MGGDDWWSVDAVMKGGGKGMVCYNCGGVGHMGKDCPSKGKGRGGFGDKGGGKGGEKGKGLSADKGKGKGKGGGYQGTCWNCGEVGHKANEWWNCPKGGKGKGGKGINMMEMKRVRKKMWNANQLRWLGCTIGWLRWRGRIR